MKATSNNTRDANRESRPRARGRRLVWIGLTLAVVAAVGVPILRSSGPSGGTAAADNKTTPLDPGKQVFAKVERGDLLISILVPGTIETSNSTTIVNRIEGEAKIIWVIDEGSLVKAGDKLVELEASGLDERIYEQRADVLRGEADYNSAMQDMKMQEQENMSNLLSAENAVEMTALELKKYEEGSYRQNQLTKTSDITIADLELQRAMERRDWTDKLVEKGYVSAGELEADDLTVKKQEIQLDQAKNALDVFENYEAKSEFLRLRNELREAQAVLERTKLDNQFKLRSRQIALETAEAELDHEKIRLAQLEEQLAYTTLSAPQDGMVVYPDERDRWNPVSIEIGADVRNRQQLLELPDFSAWTIEAKVHESVIQQVGEGLHAYVSVDAFPNAHLTGRVSKISVMPDSGNRWVSPDVKLYSVNLDIGSPNLPLKPGMTTKNEIVLAELKDVLYVSIRAVSSVGEQAYAMVKGETGVAKTPIEIGRANDRFVEVRSGLREGDQVMLTAQAGGVAGLIQRPSSRRRGEGQQDGQGASVGNDAPGRGQSDERGGERSGERGRNGDGAAPRQGDSSSAPASAGEDRPQVGDADAPAAPDAAPDAAPEAATEAPTEAAVQGLDAGGPRG
jgi:RND family efflux transporter MFP subunit